VFVLLGFLEMLRVAVAAAARREPEAWIVAAGFAPIALVLAAQQVLALANAGSMPQTAVLACMLLLFAALSVYLSRRSARTARELEARLGEVRALSVRAIEQERRAAREEAERRLVEERHERRTRELEEARRIQLAMLPPEAPAVAGFDLAFRMVTATEVGGDYVDVRADGGGGSLLAVGDATSHGLQAGMVVAVAKSLFQAAAPEGGPGAVLRRVGAGLEALRERRASMALAVLHLAPGGLRFASAGMPPLLVARGGRPVEEMLLPGVPLGTLPGVEYAEAEQALAPGDTVLAVSDGLVEAAAPGAEAFGYERAAAALRVLAGRTAREVADGMLAAVTAHLGGAAPPDDVTVVALVAR
ncbi:MAG: PP2C family protein-serine/threonine phosphatase, partial [Acidobacteriota bacterium]